ncbi:DUF2637 domain-containing protein [Pseudarthrobacter sp. AB1]|uniref:DUF2637 domain-containing protein n=1 Tax=Pseudarthrobacter sp. AB1 TaxID=2138309 RepID=UPI00186BA410|nr:DUF2637 domain-containing protein [Pseudarthrobacter sp. AB1]MBE4719505.1 hypothetical protein [Pseudarthrobacter sp. AB1]
MTSAPARKSTQLSRPIVATGLATTILIAAGAFILSFAALTDLAVSAGISPALGWIWPIIIDGLIVAATVAIVALAGHDRRTLAYPWSVLILGAVVSTGANAVHAVLAVEGSNGNVPVAVSAIVAAMPPVVLLAITHLTVVLVQKSAPAPVKAKKTAARTVTRTVSVRQEPASAAATPVLAAQAA